jgi:hypothetical protein
MCPDFRVRAQLPCHLDLDIGEMMPPFRFLPEQELVGTRSVGHGDVFRAGLTPTTAQDGNQRESCQIRRLRRGHRPGLHSLPARPPLRSAPLRVGRSSFRPGHQTAPASRTQPERRTTPPLRAPRSQAGVPGSPLPPLLPTPRAPLALACTELVCAPMTVEGSAILLFFGPFCGG